MAVTKNFNQTDFDVRMQHLGCCVSDKANSIAVDLSLGKDCNRKIQELELIVAYKSALNRYQVLSDSISEDDNCLTEEKMQGIFDHISKLCNICFQAPGFNYESQVPPSILRVTEDGNSRITENGNQRILES